MKIITVQQGTPEWHALRATSDTASEAPAMMGDSKYKTRDALMRQKVTGIIDEISPQQQIIFGRGHAVEAMARVILENEIDDDLSPITALSDDGTLLASVDGITFSYKTLFEHKLWNKDLAADIADGNLHPHYFWQLEQQLLITGAEKVIFVCSDGTRDKWAQMDYYPVKGRGQRLVAGWAQFNADKAGYVPVEAAVAVVAAVVTALPLITVKITGSIAITDNMAAFEVALKDFIEHRLILKPETDQDFADLDTQIKALKGAEFALDALDAQMLAQVEPVELAKRTKDMLLKLARDHRLMAEKLLVARKDQIKVEQVQRGQLALAEHLAALTARIGKPYLPVVTADFGAAIKGLRTVQSLVNAIDKLLTSLKISSSATADLIQINLASLRELASEHAFLFHDTSTIVLKANDDLTALIKMRIAEHAASVLVKENETRERIRAEEVARLAKQQAEAAAHAQLEADEIVRLDTLNKTMVLSGAEIKQYSATVAPPAPVYFEPAIRLAPATPPTLKLGQISERLGFNLTAEFLKNLGFEPAAREKNAVLFHERDFRLICLHLTAHIDGVQRKHAV